MNKEEILMICEKQLSLELAKNINQLQLIDFMIFISIFKPILYVTSPDFRQKHYNSINECPYKNDNYFDEAIKKIKLLYEKENKYFNQKKFESYIYDISETTINNEITIINFLFSLGLNRVKLQRKYPKIKNYIEDFSSKYIENNTIFFIKGIR